MISRVRIFSNCNSNAVRLLLFTIWIWYPLTCVFLRVFQLGKHSEETQCNRYNYNYLAVYRRLVIFLHQILVAFAGFSLESGSVGAARRWYVSPRYCWDGEVRRRRTQDLERSIQDPVGAHRYSLFEATEPMKIGAATNRHRLSPLVVSWV